jgi:hypothetical protein
LKKKIKEKNKKAISGDAKVAANEGLIATTPRVAADDPSIAATFVLPLLSLKKKIKRILAATQKLPLMRC